MKKTVQLLLTVSVLFTLILPAFALDVPKLQGRVNDYADMLSPATERVLENKLKAFEASDSTQIVVLTINTLDGEPLEEFSLKVAETWAIGQEKTDNGALLLISKADRKIRIETGYGLEGSLTDLLAGRIIDQIMTPYFKAGAFDNGVLYGVDAMISAVKGEFEGTGFSNRPGGRSRPGGSNLMLPIIIIVFVLGGLGSIRKILGGVGGAILFPILGFTLFNVNPLLLLLLLPIGFGAGLIMPFILTSFLLSGRGGGFSSGGSFSGGGGGFGGGGASGGW